MDNWPGFIQVVLAAAVDQGAPLLLVALGEIICERAGVLNLGAEGMMLMGAVCGFAACTAGSSLLAGVAAAMLVGGVFSLAHALLSVTFRANQIVSGLALSILGLGISSFIGERLNLIMQPAPLSFAALPIPLLAQIPFFGEALFRQNILAYLTYALAFAVWFMLFRTRLGLCIRAVGESPSTADVMGVSVAAVRYLCVALGGILAGLGGAYLSLSLSPGWREQMTAGRGWVALALVIFGNWHPGKATLGALLFGALYSLDTRLQARGTVIPVQFLQMIPYLGTIAFLALAQGKASRRAVGAPEALGRPYFREEKE
ncbi:MAG: ABC transporter permease [Chlamydiota bacterium]